MILPLYLPMLYDPLATVLWPLTPDPATVYANIVWPTGNGAVNPHTWSCHCICQCCMTHWLQCCDPSHLILPLYMPMLYGPLAMVLWTPTPDPATVYANVVWPTGYSAVTPHTWSCHCICQCCMAHWQWCCEPPHLILPLYMPMLYDPLATVLWPLTPDPATVYANVVWLTGNGAVNPHTWSCHCICQCCMAHWQWCCEPPHLILPLYMPMLYGPLAMVLWTPTPDPATVYANVVWPTGNGAVNPHTWSCHCICQCCMAHWQWCCEPHTWSCHCICQRCMAHWQWCCEPPHLIMPMLYGPLAMVLWTPTPDPATVYANVVWPTGNGAVNSHTWSCHCICQCCMAHWQWCCEPPHLILPLYMPMLYGPLAMVLWTPTPDPATVYANVVWPTGNGAVNPHTWSCHCICQCCMAHWLWCCDPHTWSCHCICQCCMAHWLWCCDPHTWSCHCICQCCMAHWLWCCDPSHLILPLYMPMLCDPLAMVLWTPTPDPATVYADVVWPIGYGALTSHTWSCHCISPRGQSSVVGGLKWWLSRGCKRPFHREAQIWVKQCLA